MLVDALNGTNLPREELMAKFDSEYHNPDQTTRIAGGEWVWSWDNY